MNPDLIFIVLDSLEPWESMHLRKTLTEKTGIVIYSDASLFIYHHSV